MARLFPQFAITSLLSFYCEKYFRLCPDSVQKSKSAKDSPITPRRPLGRTVSSLAEPWRRGSGFGGMIVRHNAQILPRRFKDSYAYSSRAATNTSIFPLASVNWGVANVKDCHSALARLASSAEDSALPLLDIAQPLVNYDVCYPA